MRSKIVSVLVAVVALGLSVFSASAVPSKENLMPDIENVPAKRRLAIVQFEGIREGIPVKGLLIYGPIPGDEDDCLLFVKSRIAAFSKMGFAVAGKCIEDGSGKEDSKEESVNNYAQK